PSSVRVGGVGRHAPSRRQTTVVSPRTVTYRPIASANALVTPYSQHGATGQDGSTSGSPARTYPPMTWIELASTIRRTPRALAVLSRVTTASAFGRRRSGQPAFGLGLAARCTTASTPLRAAAAKSGSARSPVTTSGTGSVQVSHPPKRYHSSAGRASVTRSRRPPSASRSWAATPPAAPVSSVVTGHLPWVRSMGDHALGGSACSERSAPCSTAAPPGPTAARPASGVAASISLPAEAVDLHLNDVARAQVRVASGQRDPRRGTRVHDVAWIEHGELRQPVDQVGDLEHHVGGRGVLTGLAVDP